MLTYTEHGNTTQLLRNFVETLRVIPWYSSGRREGMILIACECANYTPDFGQSNYVQILSAYYTINHSYSN